jgi:predicted transcriptional regulator
MACINPDGTLSPSAKAVLAILDKPSTADEISAKLNQPLFKVRASLREMAGAGLIKTEGDKYIITETGRGKV